MPEEPKKVDSIQFAGMLFLALCIDLFQPMMLAVSPLLGLGATGWVAAIPVVGQVIAGGAIIVGAGLSFVISNVFLPLLAFIFIGGWLWMKGVPFAGRLGVAGLIEIIPFVGYVPSFTVATWLAVRAANNPGGGGLLSSLIMLIPVGRVASVATKGAGQATAQGARAQAAAREGVAMAQQAAANDDEERTPERRAPRMSADIREPRYTPRQSGDERLDMAA